MKKFYEFRHEFGFNTALALFQYFVFGLIVAFVFIVATRFGY